MQSKSRRGCIGAAVVYVNPSVGYADSSPAGEPFGYIVPNSRFPFPHCFDIIPCYGIFPA